MNKPTRMKILAFLLVFGMVAAFLPACAEEPAPPTTNPTTEPTQPTEPQPADASVLLGRIDNTVLTDETFIEIMGYVNDFVEQNTWISIPLNTHLEYFCKGNNKGDGTHQSLFVGLDDSYFYTVSEETNSLLIDTTKRFNTKTGAESSRYLLMAYCLSEEYKDQIALYWCGAAHGNYSACHAFYIFPSFSASGYATIEELATAVWNEEIPAPEDAYYVASCVHWVRNIAARRDVEIFPDEE